jgi:hypothetical protein
MPLPLHYYTYRFAPEQPLQMACFRLPESDPDAVEHRKERRASRPMSFGGATGLKMT